MSGIASLKEKWLVVLDIDGTQIREKPILTDPNDPEWAHIAALKTKLESLRDSGQIVLGHVTNRMYHLVDEQRHLLAAPDYIGCTASSDLYKAGATTSDDVRLGSYDGLIVPGTFDTEAFHALCGQYSKVLTIASDSDQARLKVTYKFNIGTGKEQIAKIQTAINAELAEKHQGISANFVEDPDTTIVDFMPVAATKGSIVAHIAELEGIPAERIIAMGNSNNDKPMFVDTWNSVAVANANTSLIEHSKALQTDPNTTGRHLVAPEENARGVIWGLEQFGLC